MTCLVTQSCLNLCDPLDCSPPGTLSIEFPRQEYWSGLPLYLCKTKNTEDMVKVSCIYYLSCALWIKSVFFFFNSLLYLRSSQSSNKTYSYFKVKIALQLDTHPKVFLMVKLN